MCTNVLKTVAFKFQTERSVNFRSTSTVIIDPSKLYNYVPQESTIEPHSDSCHSRQDPAKLDSAKPNKTTLILHLRDDLDVLLHEVPGCAAPGHAAVDHALKQSISTQTVLSMDPAIHLAGSG